MVLVTDGRTAEN